MLIGSSVATNILWRGDVDNGGGDICVGEGRRIKRSLSGEGGVGGGRLYYQFLLFVRPWK